MPDAIRFALCAEFAAMFYMLADLVVISASCRATATKFSSDFKS